ncbi:hypothetical protein MGSAQ_000659 [marine sediment metagenome]|uniref:Uncharacterized protein n=1 Tax=marine sediment metagenome TaxID=412755 RepID=A0A1B6NWL0_9ZZZZ
MLTAAHGSRKLLIPILQKRYLLTLLVRPMLVSLMPKRLF